MKQSITTEFESFDKGTFSSVNTYVNPMPTDLKIFNFISSKIFSATIIHDEKSRVLKFETIPINNGDTLHFAIYFIDPVPPKAKFIISTSQSFNEDYLKLSSVEKDGLYFHKIKHYPGIDCELEYKFKVSSSYKIIHTLDVNPKVINDNEIVWNINLRKEQGFESTVVFKKI